MSAEPLGQVRGLRLGFSICEMGKQCPLPLNAAGRVKWVTGPSPRAGRLRDALRPRLLPQPCHPLGREQAAGTCDPPSLPAGAAAGSAVGSKYPPESRPWEGLGAPCASLCTPWERAGPSLRPQPSRHLLPLCPTRLFTPRPCFLSLGCHLPRPLPQALPVSSSSVSAALERPL